MNTLLCYFICSLLVCVLLLDGVYKNANKLLSEDSNGFIAWKCMKCMNTGGHHFRGLPFNFMQYVC